MTYSLDLLFKSCRQGPPSAHIYVKTHTRKDGSKLMLITPECVSYRECDHEISRLIKELQELRERAKKKFSPGLQTRLSGRREVQQL